MSQSNQKKRINTLKDNIQNKNIASIMEIMNSEEKSKDTLNIIQTLPDAQLEMMAIFLKIPENQIDTYKNMMRGEPNKFTDKLNKFDDKNVIQPGDLILMTGRSSQSKALVKLQKGFYPFAVSSHVAIVHSEFLGVDAIPKIGVSMRTISEILTDVEDEWRIIRFNGLNKSYEDQFQKGCIFYLNQPYKIKPQKASGEDFSYCSELARKIYKGLQLKNTGIPESLVIKPCDFDSLADNNNRWIDITNNIKEYVIFTKEYEAIIKVICGIQIEGVKLNQVRYQQRKEMIQNLPSLIRNGKITIEEAKNIEKQIETIEAQMNFKFWNSQ